MIVTDQILFLQMQKTGCSHVQKLLEELFGGRFVAPKHGRHDDADTTDKLISGGIRHPLDWYVSFWSFSCSGQGGIAQRVAAPPAPERIRRGKSLRLSFLPSTPPDDALAIHAEHEARRDPALWTRLHQSSDDVGAFRDWMAIVHEPEHRFAAFDDFGHSAWFGTLGLFSYLVFYLYLTDIRLLFPSDKTKVTSPENLTTACRVQHYVRTEHLEEDFLTMVRRAGYILTPDISASIRKAPKTNTSSRDRDFLRFYDSATLDLVRKLDGQLGAFHGYEL